MRESVPIEAPASAGLPLRASRIQACASAECPCRADQRVEVRRSAGDAYWTGMSVPGPSPSPRDSLDAVDAVVRSPGTPLSAEARAFTEPRFGHDFSAVRVHTDERAADSAVGVSARAYTVGSHLVFAPGQYTMSTSAGKELLAHELTHVVQQSAASADTPTEISAPSDPYEQEAARAAREVTRFPAAGRKSAWPERKPEGLPDGGQMDAFVHRQADDAVTDDTGDVSDVSDTGDVSDTSGTGDTGSTTFEVDPEDLVMFPRTGPILQPPTSGPGGGGVLQWPGPTANMCDTPSQMLKVTSGRLQGGKTMDDYFPDQVGKGIWGSNSTAGTFDTGTRAGSVVQLIGVLPIPCETSAAPTTLRQTATIVRAQANGTKLAEGGKPLEGQTLDDIARSGRDQSRPPFRQTWTGVVSMADPISGIPYAGLNSYAWEVNLTTSLAGAGGTVSVGWGVTVEASAGKVTKNEVR